MPVKKYDLKDMTLFSSYYDKDNSIVHLFEVDPDGKVHHSSHSFVPYLFIPTNKKTKFTDLNNKFVLKKEFASYKSYKNFISTLKNRGMEFYENDFSPIELQFLVERYFHIPIAERKFNLPVIHFFDIETEITNEFPKPEEAKNKVTSITIYDTELKKYFMFSLKPMIMDEVFKIIKKFKLQVDENLQKLIDNVENIVCKNEEDLLIKCFEFMKRGWIYTGWNIDRFDFPYLYNRAQKNKKVFKKFKELSPIKRVYFMTVERNGVKYINYNIVGKVCLDLLQVYKKFTYKAKSSYNLDFIGTEELNLPKLKLVEKNGRAISLKELYEKFPSMFQLYNGRDVSIMVDIEKKYNFFYNLISITHISNVPMLSAFKMSNVVDGNLLYYLRTKNKVAPKLEIKENMTYPGAYVKDSIIGLFDWLIDVDLTSSYPSHQIRNNISSETYIGIIEIPDERYNEIEYKTV